MKRKTSAVWRGHVKAGKGALSTESAVLKDTQYSFCARFENGVKAEISVDARLEVTV